MGQFDAGIIGGGLSGLACGYGLAKRNISFVILEKDKKAGGRSLYSIGFNDTYTRLLQLVQELGLKNEIIAVPPERMGIWYEDKLHPANRPSMLKLYGRSLLKIFGTLRFIGKLDFNFETPGSELWELHKITLAEWSRRRGLSKKTLETFIQPFSSLCFDEPENLAADFGLHILFNAVAAVNGKLYGLKMGMPAVAQRLEEVLGAKVVKEANVERVARTGDGFKITYLHKGSRKEATVKKAVLAVPFIEMEKLTSDIVVPKWRYSRTYGFVVKGKYRYMDMVSIIGTREKNVSRMHTIENGGETQKLRYYGEGGYDFTPFFEDGRYTVLEELRNNPAMAIPTPGCVIPNLKTDIPGLYICGDFYRYPSLEAAARSGLIVSEMIIQEK